LHGADTVTLRKIDQKYVKVLQCGVGEGWRSAGPIMSEMRKYTQSRWRGISYIQQKQMANWIG
jgi:hypothetical protein